MKGKFWRKALAAAMALLIVSGSVPIKPISDIFGDMAITANAETTTSTVNVGGTDYTLFTGFTATGGSSGTGIFTYDKMVDGDVGEYSSFHEFANVAYVEFNSDEPIIPKGYIVNLYNFNSFNQKPNSWVLKARVNAGDEWTVLSSYSGQNMVSEQQYACNNEENNAYKYFRFEASNSNNNIWLTEIRLYGSIPNVYYTHLTEKAATCTETGIKQDCYQRNDGKYFTDETGATELAESDVIDPMIPHTCEHHDATDVNIEYWQCSMCSKYFSDSGYTTEITEEQTKIYRTITIDGSISSLVTSDVSQALAGETIALYVSDLIDASTLKVNNGNVALTNVGNGTYTFIVPAADVTVTANLLSTYSVTLPANMAIVSATNAADSNGKYISGTVIKFAASLGYEATNVSDGTNTLEPDANGIYTVTVAEADINITATTESSNTLYLATANSDFTAADGNILIGATSHTVTIANNAKITLNNATITGGIVCAGTAEITLVGTNSISGLSRYDSNIDAYRYTAGIQVGGSGTTLTIKGDGLLTANGGQYSAGIGLSRAWNVTEDVIGGNIVINGGNITANGGVGAAGIGAGLTKDPNNSSERKAIVGNITIKGGTVTAVGGNGADGIGAGDNIYNATYQIGTVTIYDGIDKVDASSIKNSGSIVYKHDETDVTASKSDYFTIIENGNRRIIMQKVTPTIADVPDQTYTGSAITPEPTVIAGSLSLTKGTDYVYSYTNNTNFGTATVRATFQGDYASLGYVEKEFTILPPPVVVNVTGNGTVTYNDKSAASGETFGVAADKGTDVTLTLTPENGYAVSIEYGYTKSNGMTMNGAKLPINGTTATLTVPNDLKDGTYVNLTVTFVSALAGGADEASAVALTDNTVTDLAGGWYKVDSDITFDHTLNLLGDTHLIIDDGKTMTVNTASGKAIDSEYTLNVSGEGALNITTTEAYKIAVRVGSYVQTGATVTASGYIGIRCTDDFIAFNFDNDFTFSGGQLTATGSGGNGIWADNDITLSCTNATDYIQASSYSSAYGAVKIAEGNALTDGTSTYTGILTGDDLKAISGQTLVAAEVENTRNIVNAANITLGGELGLNFYLTIPDDAVTAGAKVVMNGPEGEKEVALSSLSKDDKGRYKVTYKIKAVYINENVSLNVTDSDGNTLDLFKASGSQVDNNTLVYSIYDYVQSAKADTALTEKEHNMVDTMYTYGAYSAKWFNGTALPDDVNELNDLNMSDYEKYKLQTDGSSSSITLTGLSLILDSNTALRLYFTSSDDISGHSAKIDDVNLTIHPTETAGKYYVEIDDISANNLISNYSIVFDGTYTATVSTMTYVYNSLKNGTTDDVMNVLKALCAYSDAVNKS